MGESERRLTIVIATIRNENQLVISVTILKCFGSWSTRVCCGWMVEISFRINVYVICTDNEQMISLRHLLLLPLKHVHIYTSTYSICGAAESEKKRIEKWTFEMSVAASLTQFTPAAAAKSQTNAWVRVRVVGKQCIQLPTLLL